VSSSADATRGDDLLTVAGVHAGYGGTEIIHGVSLSVRAGEIATLLGANGAGKSTLLSAIYGLGPWRRGTIEYRGIDIASSAPARIARHGVAYVVEGGRSFGPMTVREDLEVGALAIGRKLDAARRERIFELFPRLQERSRQLAGTLSGGERRMLAIGRALAAEPSLLLLDEPTSGLAPKVVRTIAEALNRLVAEDRLGIVIADQSLALVEQLDSKVHLLARGTVRWSGGSHGLRQVPEVLQLVVGDATRGSTRESRHGAPGAPVIEPVTAVRTESPKEEP
jgi:ABC-type branched-subunit amino acid transport system ATPase component